MTEPNAYSVRTVRSIDELSSIRDEWQRFQQHPNTDYDFYKLIVDVRDEVISPYVLVVEAEGAVISILAARLEAATIEYKIGYRVITRAHVRSITVLQAGLLGHVDLAVCTALVNALKEALAAKEASVVRFGFMPIDSCLFQVCKARVCRLRFSFGSGISEHFRVVLPSSPEEFAKRLKPKHRQTVRRYQNKLKRDYGNVELRFVGEYTEIDRLCDDVESVACKTYQRRIGVGFVDNREWRSRLRLLAEKRALFAQILYVAEVPRAFVLITIYKGVAYLDDTGYDPELSRYGVGTALHLKAIETLCRNEITRLDFGSGYAEYKQRFGNESWPEASFSICGPTIEAFSVTLIHSLLGSANRIGKQLADSVGLLNRIKKSSRS